MISQIWNMIMEYRHKRMYGKSLYPVHISYKCDINNVEFEEHANVAHHAQISNATVGKRTSIGRYTKVRDAEIERYCSISWDVTIGAVSHPSNRITSHAFTYRKKFGISSKDSSLYQKKTIIGNDVWIGCNSVIISGVKVGDGAIIGAGAVVTKDVQPYSIVAGVPAKVLNSRFEKEIVDRLEQIQWWNLEDDLLIKYQHLFSSELNEEVLNELENICNEYKE